MATVSKRKYIYKFIVLVLMVMAGALQACVDPYVLPESALNQDFLVVDGFVALERQYAEVTLSRTQNLSQGNKTPVYVNNAWVQLQKEDGSLLVLPSKGNGVYASQVPEIRYGEKYRIKIKIGSGLSKEYVSELVSTGKTPAIDQLKWKVEHGKVRLLVSTQDPTNSTRYYKWEFIETYAYNAYLESNFKINASNIVVPRTLQEQIYNCWKTNYSTAVLTTSTKNQAQDKVSEFLLAAFEGNGDRFSKRYSMLARQFAISKEEFEYLEMLRKNTENVGSLFDAQPSYVTGNITSITDPNEPVFGYFAVRSLAEKRIFIGYQELAAYKFTQQFPVCDPLEAVGSITVIDKVEIITDNPLTIVKRECADCREKGGSTTSPAFW